MLALALLPLLASADDGFGGAPAGTQPPAASSAAPAAAAGECMIRTDDGRWITCAEAVAQKDVERQVAEETRVEGAADPPPAPTPVVEEPPARIPTELEKEMVRAGIDPKLPIIALRIQVAELEREIGVLTQRGYGEGRRTELEAELARTKLVVGDIEYVALSRMLACTRKQGMKLELKRVAMTPAGPVYLSFKELVAQLPRTDPFPCGRIFLVEQADIDKVRRAHDVYRLLDRNPFGYRELDERRRKEAELAELEKWLKDEGVPALKGRVEG